MTPSQVKIEEVKGKPKEDEGGKSSSRSTRSKRPATNARVEKDLQERLAECFERVADTLENRGDEELAGIVREDGGVMSAGLVSLTRPFKAVRGIVVLFVAVLEPLLAFGRIARVVVARWATRRAERAQPETPDDAQQ